jgi:cytochrome b561
MTGWLFASFRGWSMSFFYLVPTPMLAANNAAAGKTIDGWHRAAEWALLALIVNPVAAALARLFINRDRFMARMLPG